MANEKESKQSTGKQVWALIQLAIGIGALILGISIFV